MSYSGGCDHIHTSSDNDPIDVHTCHCSVCKRVTGQATTHVAFFAHGDIVVDNPDGMNRQPFNDQNPDGPLELCTCADCGTPIMLDDKMGRIRAIAPNLMGFDPDSMPATYHAFYDPATGVPRPDDGRPVYEGLRPDFVWPDAILREEPVPQRQKRQDPGGFPSGSCVYCVWIGDRKYGSPCAILFITTHRVLRSLEAERRLDRPLLAPGTAFHSSRDIVSPSRRFPRKGR